MKLPVKSLTAAVLLLVGVVGVWLVHAAVVENDTIPFDQTLVIDCNNDGIFDDVIELQGELHVLVTSTTDKNGGVHTTLSAQPVDVWGVGAITGDTYHAVGLTRQTVNATGDNGEFTYVNNFHIVGHGSGINYKVHETAHMTIVNGNIVLTFDKTTVTCD